MKKVLCVGSVTTDIITTPVDSVPTPGTLRGVDSVTAHVGGCAANAAMDLAKLGVPVALSCKVGTDMFGDFICKQARDVGVDTRFIIRESKVPTTVSVVCVNSSGERSFLYNPGSTSAFVKEEIPAQALQENDIVFVAGAMLLNSFDGEPCAAFMEQAQGQGKYTVMDTAWDFQDIWMPKVRAVIPHLDLFMPSYEEAAKLTGETDPAAIADAFFAMGAKNVVIKVGKDGALVCPHDQPKRLMPTYRSIKPVDTTGAGDSFAAGFIAGLAQGWDYERCGAFANAVGTHCIMAIGASTGIRSIEETLQFMQTHTAQTL